MQHGKVIEGIMTEKEFFAHMVEHGNMPHFVRYALRCDLTSIQIVKLLAELANYGTKLCDDYVRDCAEIQEIFFNLSLKLKNCGKQIDQLFVSSDD